MKRCISAVKEAGYLPVPASTTEEAIAALENTSLTALLLSWTPASVELSQYLLDFSNCPAPLVAMIDRQDKDRQTALTQMKADGFLLRPFSGGTLKSLLSMATTMRAMRQKLRVLEKDLADAAPLVRRLASAIHIRTGFYQFEFIKDLLVVEVRRAKRYGYPLAIMLVGLDPIAALDALNRPTLQREITGGLAAAIAKSVRDIDIPIQYADDKILVFLPHTDLAGAEEVGKRIKRRFKRITYRGDGVMAQLTASAGVAGISTGNNLTFSRLIKDATAALKAAQLKGGDRVMKRVSKARS